MRKSLKGNAPDLPIHRRDKIVAHALVDQEDFERLNHHRWYLTSHGYARRVVYEDGRQRSIYLHREVLNATSDDPLIDHRNENPLDCRKQNLRFADKSVNRINSSLTRSDSGTGVKGVAFDKRDCRYYVYQKRNGKKTGYGGFETIEEAEAVAERLYAESRV